MKKIIVSCKNCSLHDVFNDMKMAKKFARHHEAETTHIVSVK